VAGRPAGAGAGWRRERPLVIVLDNYAVHKSEPVQARRSEFAATGIFLFYLPSYSPELSAIEQIWQTVKYHELSRRSYAELGPYKRAVEAALHGKTEGLRAPRPQPAQLLCRAA
jgi:putative transposase